ncbi:hypothetical protein BC829DRAFT_442476 [Chytridium lagenaria]|nr:hypothetical protein BC829DRAFT_442476 [Chytridium lagenaria]
MRPPSRTTSLRRITTQPNRLHRGKSAIISDPIRMLHKGRRIEIKYSQRQPPDPLPKESEALIQSDVEVGEGVGSRISRAEINRREREREERLYGDLLSQERELLGEPDYNCGDDDGQQNGWIGEEDIRAGAPIIDGVQRIRMRWMSTVPQSKTMKARLYAEKQRAELQAFEPIRDDMIREILQHLVDKEIHLKFPFGVGDIECGCEKEKPSVQTIQVDVMSSLETVQIVVQFCDVHTAALTLLHYGLMPSSAMNPTGENDNKSGGRTEVAAIFGTFCRHEVSGNIYDIDVGEKLMYATTALLDIRKQYPNRKIALSYDICCKLAAHLKIHEVPPPYIMMLPKLHSYCHDHGCQSMFAPQLLLGLGHFDGEGCERQWSILSKIIGSTHHQTFGNRRLTIALAMDYASIRKIASAPRVIAKNVGDALAQLNLLFHQGVLTVIQDKKITYKDALKSSREHPLTIEARSIVGIRRQIKSRRGTTLTSKLRVKLKRHVYELSRLLKEYNDGNGREPQTRTRRPLTFNTFGALEAESNPQDEDIVDETISIGVSDKLTAKEIFDELKLRHENNDVLEYWRCLEDLVLHQADLENAADHFAERRAFWADVSGFVDAAGACEVDPLPDYFLISAKKLIRQRSEDEQKVERACLCSDRRTEPLAAPLTGRRPEDATPWEPDLPHYCSLGPGNPSPLRGRAASRRMRLSRIGAHANGEKVAYAGPDYCDRHRRLSPGASWMQDISAAALPILLAPCGRHLRLLLDYLPLPLLTAFRPQLWGRPWHAWIPSHPSWVRFPSNRTINLPVVMLFQGSPDAIVGILGADFLHPSFPGLLSMTVSSESVFPPLKIPLIGVKVVQYHHVPRYLTPTSLAILSLHAILHTSPVNIEEFKSPLLKSKAATFPISSRGLETRPFPEDKITKVQDISTPFPLPYPTASAHLLLTTYLAAPLSHSIIRSINHVLIEANHSPPSLVHSSTLRKPYLDHGSVLHKKTGGKRDKRRSLRRPNGLPTTFNPNVVGQKQFNASLASSHSVSGRLYAFFQHSSFPYCDHNVGEFLKTESNPTYSGRYLPPRTVSAAKSPSSTLEKLEAKASPSKQPTPPATSSEDTYTDASEPSEVITVDDNDSDNEEANALQVDDLNHGPSFSDGSVFRKALGPNRKPNSVSSQVATIEVWLQALSLLDPDSPKPNIPRTIDIQKKKDVRLAVIVELKQRHLAVRKRIYQQLKELLASCPPGSFVSPLEPLHLITDRRLLALVELVRSLDTPFARAKRESVQRLEVPAAAVDAVVVATPALNPSVPAPSASPAIIASSVPPVASSSSSKTRNKKYPVKLKPPPIKVASESSSSSTPMDKYSPSDFNVGTSFLDAPPPLPSCLTLRVVRSPTSPLPVAPITPGKVEGNKNGLLIRSRKVLNSSMTFVLQDDPPSYRDYVNQLTSRLALAKSILLRESMKRRENNFRFNLVETLPDGRLLARTANSARMRPYHPSPPKTRQTLPPTVFSQMTLRPRLRPGKASASFNGAPKLRLLWGVNRELFRRFDADVLEADIDDPEFYVEKIDNHTFHKKGCLMSTILSGSAKVLPITSGLEEVEIPALLVQDYWNQMATKDPHEYRDRLRFTSKKGIPKRTKTILDILLPLITMDTKVTTVIISLCSDRRTEPLAAPLTGRRPEDATPWEPDLPHYCSLGPGNPSPLRGRAASRRMRLSRIGAHANGEKVAYAGPDYCDRHRRLSPGASWMQDISSQNTPSASTISSSLPLAEIREEAHQDIAKRLGSGYTEQNVTVWLKNHARNEKNKIKERSVNADVLEVIAEREESPSALEIRETELIENTKDNCLRLRLRDDVEANRQISEEFIDTSDDEDNTLLDVEGVISFPGEIEVDAGKAEPKATEEEGGSNSGEEKAAEEEGLGVEEN